MIQCFSARGFECASEKKHTLTAQCAAAASGRERVVEASALCWPCAAQARPTRARTISVEEAAAIGFRRATKPPNFPLLTGRQADLDARRAWADVSLDARRAAATFALLPQRVPGEVTERPKVPAC